ncbi:MAG: NAD(P)-dependent oxidoreductase [Actinobacteria bacterium]|nr:NAD(P)-dependent oxidoreductase [Actinomycetota bacterium]NDD60165.1 NAD(P)-dependent oxidoreductase [Actinomycetota bacterium]NDE51228.1 NAD(P)-dependent oxidoreductase [Actinomycetota bacterium]
MTSFQGKRVFVTGGSRGIGLAIAKRIAADGALVAIAAKTSDPHPKLPGTIFTAAKEIEGVGGQALPIQCDIRDEEQISSAISKTVEAFGGLDIVINNASAINLTPTLATPAKRFDLMFDVNVRGTFLTSQAAIPHLQASSKEGRNPHILTLSPPLSMKSKWFKNHVAYTMAKYGMSMCVLGMSEEFKRDKIAVNALWPRTAIDTAALQMIPGVDTAACRTPEILADAAYIILKRPSESCTGNFFVDDEVLASEGITDLEKYSVVPGTKDFLLDFFLD